MTGEEFLRQVEASREAALKLAAAHGPQYELSGVVPESLRDEGLWAELLAKLDYQNKKWYLFDFEIEQWQELPFYQINHVLEGMGVDDPDDRDVIKKLFWERDEKAEKREHDPEKRKRKFDKDKRDRELEDKRLAKARKKQMRGDQRELF